MRLGTPYRRSGNRWRGAVVLVSVLGYLAALIGYPMPARPRQVAGMPFPCQDHACGCADAQQCWRGCCCFTPAEKLAWAIAHRVTPPADAEPVSDEVQLADHNHDAHDHEVHDPLACAEHSAGAPHVTKCGHLAADRVTHDPHSAGHPARSCCTRHARHSDNPAVEDEPLAEQSPATSHPGAPDASNSDDEPGPLRFVSGDAWRKCRGLPTLWVATGAAVPPPPATCWQFSWVVVEWLSTSTPADCGGCLAPPVPPPRV